MAAGGRGCSDEPSARPGWRRRRCLPIGGGLAAAAFLAIAVVAQAESSAGDEPGEDLHTVAADAAAVQVVPPQKSEGPLADSYRIVSSWRVATPEALKAEIVAAEAALALRAEVDGLPVVYDSPSVSISLRKVSSEALVRSGTEVEAVDGARITIPADARVRGRHGGPVTVTITSYHAGDVVKEPPSVKYGADRQMRRVGLGPDAISGTRQKEDRVDFFMSKTSVSWRGTVNVKVPGLAAQVPAHDRPWTPFGKEEEIRYPAEKEALWREVEGLAGLPTEERWRGYRRLARKWHPDKNPEDEERATEVFTYLQEMRQRLLDPAPS